MSKTCQNCKAEVERLNRTCAACGFAVVLEPDEERKARALRRPSLGALFFTQGWVLGARLYLLFALSLIPVVGLVVLIVCVLFGRRLSWKQGGWNSWEEFQERMRLLDLLGILWIVLLAMVYWFARN